MISAHVTTISRCICDARTRSCDLKSAPTSPALAWPDVLCFQRQLLASKSAATSCSHMQGCVCSGSCSSLHYDPYQNLLWVVRGRKTVHLFSPSCGPDLTPQPIWGESPNHSPVNTFEPDFVQHPGLDRAMDKCVTCHLQVGCVHHVYVSIE